MKKGFLKRPLQSDEMALQITSMADIFMILVVFLLKSYAVGAVSITPAKGLLLPSAQAASPSVEALKLEISETAVQIEGRLAANLKAFSFEAADIGPNGASKSLGTEIEKERKRQLLIAQSNSDVKVDSKVIVVADKRVPYSTVKTVLASAAVNGYTDFKLAVVNGE